MATPFSGETPARRKKVRWIFNLFDLNGDGYLNRSEMASLVAAVNSTLDFTGDQISSITDDVFRSYSEFISESSSGISLDGLIQTYADGAGDLDRDFAALSLSYPNPVSSDPVSKPNHGVDYDSTWKLIDELEIAIIRAMIRSKSSAKDGEVYSDGSCSAEKLFRFNEKSIEFRNFLFELKEIRAKIGRFLVIEEAFSAHLSIGKTLFECWLFREALESFRHASDLLPADPRPNFQMGNTFFSLGRIQRAKANFRIAMELAEGDSSQWLTLIPEIHVNLGIVMESEGLVINAGEHYRKAAVLSPSHYRALKLLGSALFAVGEYEPAEKALQEAILLNPDYADAHCDLGCVFHAVKEDEKAILAFQKAIDLKPDHLGSLYNLGSLFLKAGRYWRALEMFGRVVEISPGHWKARLNRGISLFGAGEFDGAKKALSEALKISNRIELYEAIQYLKLYKRKKLNDGRVNWVVVHASKFWTVDSRTTDRRCILDALWTREIQKATKFGLLDVDLLRKEVENFKFRSPFSDTLVRKAEAEVLLHNLLHFVRADAFRDAVKTIDEKIWRLLDIHGSGKIELRMFFAVVAPICGGPPESRKRAAFDALSWQTSENGMQKTQLSSVDACVYIRNLRMIYVPSLEFTDLMEISGEENVLGISFHEFVDMFDDINHGFGIMNSLLKLERGDKVRRRGRSCGVCRYRISNIMFKEMKARFSLCPSCYSECKVPSAFGKEDEYIFKECLVE